MKIKPDDLKQKITEKNIILNTLDPGDKAQADEINRVKRELDNLLYLYYKSLAYCCSDMLAC